MRIMNPITASIVKNAANGDTIMDVSRKTGFAYSAVYRWIKELEKFGVLNLNNMGNRVTISVNKELVYKKFMELSEALEISEKDNNFWKLMKNAAGVRCTKGTAAAIWTQGGYITGDFFDKIYHVDALEKDLPEFIRRLKTHNISYGEEKTIPNSSPFVCITSVRRFSKDVKNSLPVMPLDELVAWCNKLHLEPVLEQLDLMYKLGLQTKYSEVYTNV